MDSPEKGMSRRDFLRGALAVPVALGIGPLLAACGRTATSEVANQIKTFTEQLGTVKENLGGLKTKADTYGQEISDQTKATRLKEVAEDVREDVDSLLELIAEDGTTARQGKTASEYATKRRDALLADTGLSQEERDKLNAAWGEIISPLERSGNFLSTVRVRLAPTQQSLTAMEHYLDELIALEPFGGNVPEKTAPAISEVGKRLKVELGTLSADLDNFIKQF